MMQRHQTLGTRRKRFRCLRSERLEPRMLLAGPYAPAAEMPGTTAISRTDPALVAWASEVVQYNPGVEVDAEFQEANRALGPAEGTSFDTVSLGRGGSITLGFEQPIRDGLGFDFAVFENAVSDTFLELGFVEVSSDGVNFFGFPTDSRTPSPVDAFGALDPTNVHNLAGKYREGFGTPFDLEELDGVSPLLDTSRISHVRIVDIVGDGETKDSSGRPIYDPYPTIGSAGFDLDAVGVIRQAESLRDVISFEDLGAALAPSSAFRGPLPDGIPATGPFQDSIVLGTFRSERLEFNNAYSLDYGSWNQWAYSNVTNSVTPGFSNQFGVIAGEGGNGTPTFGVGFADGSGFYDPPAISRPADDVRTFSSLLLTNTTYAALAMRDGDSFAKKFGGDSGNDEDYFKVTITGKDASGESIGSVDVYLADYRFADNSKDYIVDQWVEVDLSSIGAARSLEFSVSSSDVGPFGINTPAYFAVDEITLTTPTLLLDLADAEVSEADGPNATIARISRADADVTSELAVSLEADESSIVTLPATVTIPAGESYVEFPIGTLNNDQVHGDRSIEIEASAVGMVSTRKSLLVLDDDALTLTLSLASNSVIEGNGLVATVAHNHADLGNPLSVSIVSSVSDLFAFDPTLTIEAGQSSADLFLSALEDQVDRADTEVVFSVTAEGYLGDEAALAWIDNDEPQLLLTADSAQWNESMARPAAGFEDVGRSLINGAFYNGADLSGSFTSGGLVFNNDYDPTFGSWSGWSFSNTGDATTPGFGNQYSAWVGAGANQSDTYAVAASFGFPALPSIRRDPENSTPFHSIDLVNTTYTALSMKHGDAFAKKFGGESGSDPDWLLLTIEGLDQAQTSIGTVEFYLADYRFSDDSLDYIVDQWTTVSLESISQAVELRFSMSSSDVGEFGMNTPAYFAADQVTLVGSQPLPTVTVSRNSFDLSVELPIWLISSDATEARSPHDVVIPAGASSVEVPLEILADQLVDGPQTLELTAGSTGFASSTLIGVVADQDVPELTLTLSPWAVSERDGSLRAVVHRNVEDVSAPLVANLTADPTGDLLLPESVSIPTGRRSTAIDVSVIDNDSGEGDRVVSVEAISSGFASGEDSATILDDEDSLRLEIDRQVISEDDAALPHPITVTVRRSGPTVDALQISLSSSDDTEVDLPQTVMIPIGSDSVSFEIHAVDDDIVDGAQSVDISASADGFVAAAVSITVEDNDLLQLTASVTKSSIAESDDESANSIVIHRNSGDLSGPLLVTLETDMVATTLPAEVLVPANAASVEVPFGSLDNQVRDGERRITIRASAEAYGDGVTEVTIIDDEVSELLVVESDASTSVNELGGMDAFEVSLASQPLTNVLVTLSSSSEDFAWSPTSLTFTPENWDQPQEISVLGNPDLVIEGNETHSLVVQVDPDASDDLYALSDPIVVDVEVIDGDPTALRVSETDTAVLLMDAESGVQIYRNSLKVGMQVVANEHAQEITLDNLVQTGGLITVDAGGGDDLVTLRGPRFTSIDGGDGYDALILALDRPIEFAGFLDQRVIGFEEYVLKSESRANLRIDSDRLGLVAGSDGSIRLRVMADQSLTFSSDAELLDPQMVEGSFAHVVQLGDVRLFTITTTPWQNILSPPDVNGSGSTTSLDALTIINELDRRQESELPLIDSIDDFTGFYFDVSGDGSVSALDSLLVINAMAVSEVPAEAERVTVSVNTAIPLALRHASEPSSSSEPTERIVGEEHASIDRLPSVHEGWDQALLSLADEWSVAASVDDAADGSDGIKPLHDPIVDEAGLSTGLDLS